MSAALTFAVTAGLYAAAAVAVAGVTWRCARYARRRPVHGRALTPAPTTRTGVALRLLAELVLFRSLFRGDRLAWLLGWVFHAALAVIALDHLWLLVDPVWPVLWRLHAETVWIGALLLAALAGLALRRLLVARVRYVSAPSDHLHLVLLAAIVASGLAMRTVAPVDLGGVRAFTLGLVRLDWQAFPPDPVLLAHVTGAVALLVVFPFSKLMHAPGIAFSPTLARRGRPEQGERGRNESEAR